MEKNKRWQISLIVVVLLLTLYNILPTLFFYSKPLNEPIGAKQATQIAKTATSRVNSLEKQTENWVYSFAKLLKVKVKSVDISSDLPQEMAVRFNSEKDEMGMKKSE